MPRPKITDDLVCRVLDHLGEDAYQQMLDMALEGKLSGHTYTYPVFYGGRHEFVELSLRIPSELLDVSKRVGAARGELRESVLAELGKKDG